MLFKSLLSFYGVGREVWIRSIFCWSDRLINEWMSLIMGYWYRSYSYEATPVKTLFWLKG